MGYFNAELIFDKQVGVIDDEQNTINKKRPIGFIFMLALMNICR